MSEAKAQNSAQRSICPRDGDTYRHKIRGSTYRVIGRVTLQTGGPIGDDQELVIYRGDDGQLWARSITEFCDGRFEP
jgi:hypothetical protein